MDWTRAATGRLYTGRHEAYQALVWRTSTGEWVALLSHRDVAVAHTCCPSVAVAQAWCDAQLGACCSGSRPDQRTA